MVEVSKPIFIVGTTISAVATGLITGISIIHIPAILRNPNEAIRLAEWRTMFNMGVSIMPPLAFTSALCSWANAYLHRTGSTSRTYKLIAAGVLTVAIVPWTLIMMSPTNQELFRRDDLAQAAAAKDDDIESGNAGFGLNDGPAASKRAPRDGGATPTNELIRRWALLNFIRGMLPLAGTLSAFSAL